MAELATYIGIEPRTVQNASGSTIGRGLRVVLGSGGTVTLAGLAARGDYITLQDIPTGEAGLAASLSGGGKVGAQSSEAANAGDLAYSVANGQVSKTATSAVLVGRWTQPALGGGALSEVELFNLA